MSLRDDLVPVVDELRALPDELGFRPYTTVIRTTTWTGGEPGRGTRQTTDLTISPVPKVSDVPERLIHAAPGKYEQGDRFVSKISATYTRAQLTGGDVAAGVEVVWLIDGEEYTLVGTPEERPLEWRVTVRRRARAPRS
jgi:hypothetical protein